jgi:hypothetical protein
MGDGQQLLAAPHSIEAEQALIGGLFLDTKAFDKINGTVTHSDGPRPAPMPGGQEWYEVANCFGEIHDSGY